MCLHGGCPARRDSCATRGCTRMGRPLAGGRAPCHVPCQASQAATWLRGAWQGQGRLRGGLPGCSPSKGPGQAGRQRAAQHSSCCQRHQVTAAWKGESGEAGISLLCPPAQEHTTESPAFPQPAFAAPVSVGVRPGGKAGPSGWELPGIHIPKITTSIAATQVIPASPSPQHVSSPPHQHGLVLPLAFRE